jgi:hypothetical protein
VSAVARVEPSRVGQTEPPSGMTESGTRVIGLWTSGTRGEQPGIPETSGESAMGLKTANRMLDINDDWFNLGDAEWLSPADPGWLSLGDR